MEEVLGHGWTVRWGGRRGERSTEALLVAANGRSTRGTSLGRLRGGLGQAA